LNEEDAWDQNHDHSYGVLQMNVGASSGITPRESAAVDHGKTNRETALWASEGKAAAGDGEEIPAVLI
jgi:hypothetical protein